MTLSFKVNNQNGTFKLAKSNTGYRIGSNSSSNLDIDNYYYDNTLLMHFNDSRTGTFDQYGDRVTLLMHMNGSGNTFQDDSLYGNTITSFGSATQSTDQSKFGNSSAYFNGSSYISAGASSNWNLSSGDFTIEGWVYNTGSNQYRGIIGSRANGNGHGWCLYIHSNNTFYTGSTILGQGYADRQLNTTTVPPNTWTHFALVKTSAGYRLYVNGVSGSLLELSNGFDYQSSQSLVIGALGSQGEYPFLGYIDEIRITKGVARYLSDFTPSDSPYSQVLPLFIDSSAHNNSLIVSSATITNSESKFGGYSSSFNGSSYVRSAGTDIWQLGTDDFTVESWVKPTSLSGRKSIVGTYDGSNGGWALSLQQPTGGTASYGPEITFTKTDYGNEVDIIIPGALEIYRGSAQGLYNQALESYYDRSVSPSNTLWNRCSNFYYDGYSGYCQDGDSNNWNNICNYTTRTYGVWWPYATNGYNTPSMVGKELIMKHVPTNRYWLIKFTSWTSWANGGGFSYTRKEILSCAVDSSIIQFRNGDSSVIEKTTSSAIPTGTWSHIAAVRSSGVLKLFLDGTQVGSDSSFTSNITRNNSYGLSIGATILSNGSASDYLTGYLDELRITKGTARYLSNFTPPTTALSNNGPSASVPSEPLNLAVSEDQGIVSLSWSKSSIPRAIDTRSPISYYGVEYSNDGGSSWTEDSGPFVVESTLNFNSLSDFTDNFTTSQPSWYTYSISNGSLQINAPSLDRSSEYSFIQNKNLLEFEINFLTTYHGYRVPYLTLTNDLGSVYISYNTNWVGPQPWSSALGSDYPNNVIVGITPAGGSTTWYAHSSPRLDNSAVFNTIKATVNTTNQTMTLVINGISNTYSNNTFGSGFKNFAHNPMAMNFNNSYITYINYIKYTTDDTSATNRRLYNLTGGNPYLFRTRAQNSVGFGDYSSTAQIIVPQTGPTILSAIPEDSQAYVSWDPPLTDAYYSNVSLLLKADSSPIIDSSYSPKAVSAINVPVSSTQSKFGGSSLYLNPLEASSYLSFSQSNDLNFGTGDFTIEFWIYPNSTNAIRRWVNHETANGLTIRDNNYGNIHVYTLNDSNSYSHILTGTPVSAGQWQHIAVVRYNGTIYVYKNGVYIGSTGVSYPINMNGFILGSSGGEMPDCYIDDFRITKGAARYTSTTSNFTAPTTEFLPYAPNNSSIRDYAVQYSANGGVSWTTFSHSSSIDTLINVTGLSNGSDYVFRVAAVNLAGTGVYSSNSSSINVAPRSDNLYNKTRILLHLDSN